MLLSLSLMYTSMYFIVDQTYRPDRASLDLNETDELEDSDSLKLTRESHPIERSRRYVRTYLT